MDGKIDWVWMQIQLWRSLICQMFHYLFILSMLSLSRWLGFFTNMETTKKMEDILDRPNDDNVDIFAKIN